MRTLEHGVKPPHSGSMASESGPARAGTARRFEAAFRARGLRVTPQRALVFRLIEEMQHQHPSAEAIYTRAVREMPTMSLRTVYTVLDALAEAEEIRPLDLGTGSKRVCATAAPHHHLVCDRCGRVEDAFVEVGPLEVPRERRQGFLISEYAVVFRGLCPSCRS